MFLPTWQRIDRDALLVELRRAVAAGGMLAVKGDDATARPIAANLAVEFLAIDLGLEVYRVVEPAGRPDSVRDRLLNCWQLAHGDLPDNVVAPWLTRRSFITEDEIIGEIAGCSDQPAAYVFDTVDSALALPRGLVGVFEKLATVTESLVVAFFRAETGSDLRGARTHALATMTVHDVEAKLYASRAYLGLDVEVLDAIIDDVRAIEVGGRVSAQDVYDLVAVSLPEGV